MTYGSSPIGLEKRVQGFKDLRGQGLVRSWHIQAFVLHRFYQRFEKIICSLGRGNIFLKGRVPNFPEAGGYSLDKHFKRRQ
jgi:hypothetical protein